MNGSDKECTFDCTFEMRYLNRSFGLLLQASSLYIAFSPDKSLNSQYYNHEAVTVGSKNPICLMKFADCFKQNQNQLDRIICMEKLKPKCTSILEKGEETDGCEGTEMMLTYRANSQTIFDFTAEGKDLCYVYPVGDLPFDLVRGARLTLSSEALNGNYRFPELAFPQEKDFLGQFTDNPICDAKASPFEVTYFPYSNTSLQLWIKMTDCARMKKYLTVHVHKTANFSKNGVDKTPSQGKMRICGNASDFKPRNAPNSKANKGAVIGGVIAGVCSAGLLAGGSYWWWRKQSSESELELYFEHAADESAPRASVETRETRPAYV